MLHALSKTGIVNRLFLVEGDLIENYNRALEAAVGKRTQATSFYIDKRGESPELEEELGKNYLQAGPAHRYCIVVSPDQKEADLLHEEFSFDNQLLDLLYKNYLSGISLATRVDGMYGELDDEVREFETLEDLLLAKSVNLELHTPSKFLTTARELQACVVLLKMEPNLLIDDDSALPRKILKFVGEVGDIRNYDIRPLKATKGLTTFYTRLFGGVCVFRNVGSLKTLSITRPDREHFIYDLTGDPLGTPFRENNKEEPVRVKSAPPKTVVIYREKDYHPEDGPTVQFIPLQEKQRVIDFLVEYSYAEYAEQSLEFRLSRLEDETLLSKGHDVTEMEKEQQVQLVHDYRDHMLFEWYELKEIKRKLTKGHALQDVIKEYSPTTQSMLLVAELDDESTAEVIKHLITRLFDYDYEKMYAHNRRHLENIYKNSDENKQKYILNCIED